MSNEKPIRKTTPKPEKRLRGEEEPTAAGTKPGTRVRLQRALASAGYGSRRQCEELIVEGRIIVDGKVVDELGVTVEPGVQKIYVDGTPLKPRRLVYYALNKPVGIVTTNVDPEGRPRVIDLVPPDERVFPVGRLDRSSEGLILLTNDGELAQRLAHPKYEIQKVYRVVVAGKVLTETLKQMEKGIYIAEGLVKVEGAKVMKTRGRATELEITLKEGKNREIRRILARLGHKVQQLKRIAIGPLRLGEMPTGAFRKLGFDELKKLKVSVETSARKPGRSDDDSETPRRPPMGKRATPSRGGKTTRPYSGTKKVAGSKSQSDAPTKKFSKKVAGREAASDSRRPMRDKTTANRRPLPKRKADTEIKFDRVVTGSIIGADPLPPKQEKGMREDRIPRPKKAAPKRASTKRSFGRGDKKATSARQPTDDSRSGGTRGTKRARPKRKGD
jgi:23S rRNA pseudouridine2605 synthase